MKYLQCVFVVFYCVIIYNPALSQGTWTALNPISPSLDGYFDIFFVGNNDGWAVGEDGIIANTKDGGVTWTTQTSPVNQNLFSTYFINVNEGWIAGDGGTILHTQNGGETWLEQATPLFSTLNRIFFLDANNGFAAGASNVIYKTGDGGQTWTHITLLDNTVEWDDIYFFNTEKGLVFGKSTEPTGPGFIDITFDGGLSWDPVSGPFEKLTKSFFIDNLIGWVVGEDGKIYKTITGGEVWTEQLYSPPYDLFRDLSSIHFTNPDTGVVVGASSRSMWTHDGGNSWVTSDTSLNLGGYSSVFITPNSAVWAVGSMNGGFYKSDDFGQSWTLTNAFTTHALFNTYFLNPLKGWVVDSQNGDMYETGDGGQNWIEIPTGVNSPLTDVWFIDEDNGFICGSSGKFLSTQDGGQSWVEEDLVGFPNAGYFDIQFLNENIGWASANGGYILKTVNGGQTWENQNPTGTQVLTNLYFIHPDTGWVVDRTNSALLFTSNGGNDWENLFFDQGFKPNDVFFTSALEGWATGHIQSSFDLAYTNDGGQTWIPQHQIMFDTLNALLTSIQFTSALEGWIVGNGSRIYHTINGGQTWELTDLFSDQELLGLHFVNSNFGLAVGRGGVVYKYNDPTTSFVESYSTNDELNVFPNPAFGFINVETPMSRLTEISIYSVKGELLRNNNDLDSSSLFRIDLTGIPIGVYIIIANAAEEKVYRSKFIVLK